MPTVLFIEKNEDIRYLVSRFVGRAFEIRVIAVASPEEALTLIDTEEIDILVISWFDESLAEVIERIQVKQSKTPLILYSVNPERDRNAGLPANAILVTQPNFQGLISKIGMVIGGRPHSDT